MKKVILIAAAALMTLSASAQNLKFAHVNFNELVMLQPAADSARAQLAASQQDAQDTFKSMQDEFQAKYTQYQQKVNTWTPAIRESKEKELQDIQNRIEEFNQSIQQELQQQQSQLMRWFTNLPRKAVSSTSSKRAHCCLWIRLRVLTLLLQQERL